MKNYSLPLITGLAMISFTGCGDSIDSDGQNSRKNTALSFTENFRNTLTLSELIEEFSELREAKKQFFNTKIPITACGAENFLVNTHKLVGSLYTHSTWNALMDEENLTPDYENSSTKEIVDPDHFALSYSSSWEVNIDAETGSKIESAGTKIYQFGGNADFLYAKTTHINSTLNTEFTGDGSMSESNLMEYDRAKKSVLVKTITNMETSITDSLTKGVSEIDLLDENLVYHSEVSSKAGNITNTHDSEYQHQDGKVVITWNQVYGAEPMGDFGLDPEKGNGVFELKDTPPLCEICLDGAKIEDDTLVSNIDLDSQSQKNTAP